MGWLWGFLLQTPVNLWTDVIIEQKTAVSAMIENGKDNYLPHGSGKSIIGALTQSLNIQPKLPVSINIIKLQAIPL